ncbi:hypothetical protein [Streptomyces sp. NPDC053079]|uniref:hypothetical protein n=1 Tax=Streptomyces sp. NPDC053079 TaxID=3365697 RepID=UPI0037CD0B71
MDVQRSIRGIKDEPAIEAHFKHFGIANAVIVTRNRRQYSVLLPPGSTRGWDIPWAECVGTDHQQTHLAVPHPERRAWPGAYWLLPAPDTVAALAAPQAVLMLIGGGRGR